MLISPYFSCEYLILCTAQRIQIGGHRRLIVRI
jgi:hypothetical protein